MNFERYPWLADLSSSEAKRAIEEAKVSYKQTGAVTFPDFLSQSALDSSIQDAREQQSTAFTTDDVHTAYLRPINQNTDPNSVENHEMRTQVASIAFDELPKSSTLAEVYRNPSLRELVARIVGKREIYLSEDPLGCCSINVFRPGYHHSFHFDESEFSVSVSLNYIPYYLISLMKLTIDLSFKTTLMLQEASKEGTGLFQYTRPLRDRPDDLALEVVAKTITRYDKSSNSTLLEAQSPNEDVGDLETPPLHTLDFVPGTLSIFAGSKSLHRVTKVEGNCSRLVAVFTFASQPGFQNTPEVQKMFWGRSSAIS